ncbi:Cilia- and flagella-associated protein 74 [Acropora cervicornis]|uniref:Cilia- and flagella-associated protein 74 n=1 Tax=Acropora cervicornis TaxID=6130 RepID=A0AAD9US72_ACRCE|nr:Cilia- and flagella-associated protein 74 [Acropora cervicornis]
MAEVDLDEEVIELSTEEPRSDNTNEIATKDFMNGERSRESIHNHWQFSDEGPIEYESDPSSDIDKNYFSDQESLTGSMDGGFEEDEYTSDPIAQQTRQEKLQHLALRRHLDKLSEQVLEKDYLVSQEELKKCEDHIEELQKQKEMVNSEIEEAESQNNMASLYRLQGFDSKLCAEIDAEKDVHRDIFHRLQEAEFALAQATVEQGKFLLAGNELEKQDKLVEKQKADQSAVRLRKENMSAVVSDRRRRAREKEGAKTPTSNSCSKEEQRTSIQVSQRDNVQENLRALQARDAKKRLEKEEEELLERQEILAEGLNPDEELTRRKRIRQFEKDKEAYERRQRERQVEIADSIMKEEKQMKKRYQQQPHLWPDKQRERVKRINRRRPKPKFFKSTSGSSDSEGEGEELAQPEFRGLWEEDVHKEMMENALMKQRAGIVQKQIAVGREFKGCAFYSKPEVITFKDFDVGKSYKKKILLTNISYTQNYCKYVGMSHILKDFVEVFFEPPGVMSAGLTCNFTVTFKPMISVDVTEVEFGSQVLGETRKRIINVTNNGALGTQFEFKKITGLTRSNTSSELISIGGMTATDVNAAHQDFKQNVEQQNPEGMVEDTKEPQGGDATDRSPDLGVSSDDRVMEGLGTTERATSVLAERTVEETDGLSSGEISAFSLVQLEVIFNPTKSGNAQAEFEISFSDPLSPPIVIRVRGIGIDVPVWVEREVVDLKICMYDRLYQDAILELKNHLELLPKTAYIQAESQFSAQLKFLPRQTLPGDCPTYFDHETRLLEAPMVIRVADQTRPVPFSVRAVVTSSDIEFNAQDIDFGFCTVLESVRRTVTVTNKSVLPQQFGFCGVPDTIDVQPNDGFGTLLPLESYDVDIMFNAKKAKEYDFDLTCKTGIGREFTLHCRAVGVLPPLELSHSVIKMKATAVSDTCSSHIEVINSHTSANEFTHPVPRIGSGPIVEVGTTSFEFVLPSEAPLTISPAVGTVGPGQRCLVHVTFSPRIDPNMLRLESVRMMEREAEAKRKRLEQASPQEKPQDQPAGQKKKGGKPTAAGKSAKTSPKRGVTPSSTNLATRAKSPEKTFSAEDVVDGSNDYYSAHLSLLRTYQNTFSRYVIPCFVAFGKCTEPNTLSCSAHNTMYLEVHCPAVRPHVVVVSDCGRTVVDFENVSLGQAEVKTLTIQNISDEPCELTSSLLDPHGPFQMLNALRVLAPQATHNVAISFGPLTAKEFHELLEVRCPRNTLNIKLKGRGVQPVISLSVEDGLLDVGDALVGDTISSSFTISNNSELSINYSLKLDSLSPLRHSRAQVLPNFLPPFCEMAETQLHVQGPSNNNGMAVFNCVPAHGTIGPGESKEVTVSFSPDHASELYADEVSVEINSGDKPYAVKLLGRGWQNIMYTRGWDELMPRAESLRAEVEEEEEEDQGKALQKTVLLTMKSISTPRGFEPAERAVEIGCIKSSIQIKKSCDFAFDNPKEANERGFNFDPLKPNFPVNTATVLTVKSDVTTQYKILLQGLIATAQRDPGVENHVDSTVQET